MPNWSKIYFGDYTKDGYERGKDDYSSSGVKNGFRFFKALHPVNYIWNFNNSFESFSKNYNKGFDDTQKANNQTYTTKGETMGLESTSKSFENMETINMPKNNKNNFAYQISVAESLYSLFLQVNQNVDSMGSAFGRVVKNHSDLMDEYFATIIENHMIPRLKEIGSVYQNIQESDLKLIKGVIEKLNDLVHGFKGTAESNKFFNHATLSLTHTMPSIYAPQASNDYSEQLDVARSIRKLYLAFVDDLSRLIQTLQTLVDNHKDLMKQDYKSLDDKGFQPRLAQLNALINNIKRDDVPVVEDMIQRLQRECD